MTLRLPTPPQKYDPAVEAQAARAIEAYATATDGILAAAAAPVAMLATLSPGAKVACAAAFQIGASYTLPAGTMTTRGGLRIYGLWEFLNTNAATASVTVRCRIGGTDVFSYTTGTIAATTGKSLIPIDWTIAPAGSARAQAHRGAILDSTNLAYTTLPVDFFSTHGMYFAAVAKSAVDLTQAVQVQFVANGSVLSGMTQQFLGGSVEFLSGTPT